MEIIRDDLLPAALKALDDGRLWWRVTDQHTRPANGGDKSHRLPPVGEWSPRIERVEICTSGYHVTREPIRWSGFRVWLVEVDEVVQSREDKAVCRSYRALAEVDPDACVDPSLLAACSRPTLSCANLSRANLSGADLDGTRNLKSLFYDRWTVWPEGFDPIKAGCIKRGE